MKRLLLLVLLNAATLAIGNHACGQLLNNGGFDDNGGSMDNWTVVDSNGATWQAESSRGQIGGPQAGTAFAINLFDGAGAYFYQSFTTLPGATYDLSFFGARPQANNANVAIDIDVFNGAVNPGGTGSNGDLLDEMIANSDIGLDPEWVPFSYQFTATSANSTLRFLDPGTNSVDPAIDSVAISLVPEPSSIVCWMMLAMVVGVMVWRKRNVMRK